MDKLQFIWSIYEVNVNDKYINQILLLLPLLHTTVRHLRQQVAEIFFHLLEVMTEQSAVWCAGRRAGAPISYWLCLTTVVTESGSPKRFAGGGGGGGSGHVHSSQPVFHSSTHGALVVMVSAKQSSEERSTCIPIPRGWAWGHSYPFPSHLRSLNRLSVWRDRGLPQPTRI